MNDKVELFDLDEREANTGRPGGRTWVFTGPEYLTVKYSEMWDPALVQHAHSNEQINLVLGGHVLFRVGDEVFELSKGTAIRIPPNVPHGLEKKLSDEDFKVIQLIAPAEKNAKESVRLKDNHHQGWPEL